MSADRAREVGIDFQHGAFRLGLSNDPVAMMGAGLCWLDFDNDGWLDLVTVNGDVRHIEALVQANDPFPLHQPNQIFRSLGRSAAGSGGVESVRFEEVTDRAGPAFSVSEVSRGAAFGDPACSYRVCTALPLVSTFARRYERRRRARAAIRTECQNRGGFPP